MFRNNKPHFRKSAPFGGYGRAHHRGVAAIESLEERTLLSSISLSKGKLTVIGSNVSDNIVVSYANSNTLVRARVLVGTTVTAVAQFATSSISSVLINGLNGNDIISNHTWIADTILGGNGHDRIAGGHGNTAGALSGQAGNDVIEGRGGNDVIYGQDGNDLLLGGAGNDIIGGGNGSDRILGQLDNDKLYGGVAGDIIRGGHGHDWIYGEEGNDGLHGEHGIDRIYGGVGYDSLFGGSHIDYLYGEHGNDYIRAGLGHDVVYAGEAHDTVYGEEGNDRVYGQNGNDLLYGNEGNDSLFGGDVPIADWYTKSSLDLIFTYETGHDVFYGGDGDDYIHNGYGALHDRMFGEAGNDSLYASVYSAYNTEMDGGDGDDFIDSSHALTYVRQYGRGGNDRLIGGYAGEFLFGGSGEDVVEGGYGADEIHGGHDNDTLYTAYRAGTSYFNVFSLTWQTFSGSDGGGNSVYGGNGDDIMWAQQGDTYDGNAGADRWSLGFDLVQDSDRFDPYRWAILGSGDASATSYNDIEQGAYGNCYFWAALGAVAHSGYNLEAGIAYLGGNNFRVRIHNGTSWINRTVSFDWRNGTVQNQKPANGGTGDPDVYHTSSRLDNDERDFWTVLYWRAWNGYYTGQSHADEGGWAERVIPNLSGRSNLYQYADVDASVAKSRIIDAIEQGYAVAASTFGAFKSAGFDKPSADPHKQFVSAHAYVVVAATSSYIELYNPWHKDGTGSDYTISGTDDGVVRRSWTDFQTYFEDYVINRA